MTDWEEVAPRIPSRPKRKVPEGQVRRLAFWVGTSLGWGMTAGAWVLASQGSFLGAASWLMALSLVALLVDWRLGGSIIKRLLGVS